MHLNQFNISDIKRRKKKPKSNPHTTTFKEHSNILCDDKCEISNDNERILKVRKRFGSPFLVNSAYNINMNSAYDSWFNIISFISWKK